MEKRRVLQLFRSARHPLPNSLKHPIMELNTSLCKDGCDRKEGKTMSKVKRSFRKGLCVIMVGLLLVALVGCGAVAKPESMVSKYCDALKAFDMESAATCFASGDANIENPYTEEAAESQDIFTEQALEYLKKRAQEMTYTVGESAIDGDSAVVPVTFTYVDASPVISSAFGEYISQAFALALGGADETTLGSLFGTIFMEKTESVSTGTATATVEFECIKDGKEWKLQDLSEDTKYEIGNIITCNLLKSLEAFNNNFNGEGLDDSAAEETEDLVWSDVPAGQTLELATVKMAITGCAETDKLTHKYLDPDVAAEGTKFVVLTVELENITKSTLDFSNDICLYDSQDREYQPYSDALLYFDETFTWAELAPNIKTTGTFVYHVPADAADYYLVTAKSGTNEAYRLYAE